jgi:hypothetical protein
MPEPHLLTARFCSTAKEVPMFDDRDPNRDLGRRDAYLNDPAVSDGSGAAPLVALAVIALIVGGLFWFAPRDNAQVATNNPAAERSAPAPKAPVTPAPPTTAPAAPQ